MADTPSLSEITSVKGDADIGYGTAGVGGSDVKYDFSKGLSFLAQAAQEKAAADRFKVQTWQQNLENFYKDFNELSVDGVMERDLPEISNEYAQLTSDLAANYDLIRNPNKDLAKWSDLRRREAMLRGKISQSKQDVAYRKQFNDMVNTTPSLNTDSNRKIISDFTNSQLGQRQYNTLATPYAYNPAAVAKLAREAATTAVKSEEDRRGVPITDVTEIKKIEKDAYMNVWRTAHNNQDALGRSGFEAAQDAYQKSGASERGVDFNTWLDKMGEDLMGSEILESSKTSKLNEAEEKRLEREQRAREFKQEMDWKYASLRQSEAQFNKQIELQFGKNPSPEELGRFKNEMWAQAFTTGSMNLNFADNIYGDKTVITKKIKGNMYTDKDGVVHQGNGIPEDETREIPMQRKQVIGTKLEDGKLVVTLFNNETNKEEKVVRNNRDAYVDFNRVMGDKYLTQTDSGARLFMEKRIPDLSDPSGRTFLKNPKVPDMQKYFEIQNEAAANAGGANGVINLRDTTGAATNLRR